MLLTIIILIYLVSIAIGYIGNRCTLLTFSLDGDGVFFITIFIPGINVVWGVLGIIAYLGRKTNSKNFYNKFFRIR